MKKTILSVSAAAIVLLATIVPLNTSLGQDSQACDNCVEESILKYVRCVVLFGKYSNSDHWVVFGTGDKAKCKKYPNATCDQGKLTGCETNNGGDIIPD